MDHVLQFRPIALVKLTARAIIKGHDGEDYTNPDHVAGDVFAITKEGHCMKARAAFKPSAEMLKVIKLMALYRDYWAHVCTVVSEDKSPYFASFLQSKFELVVGELPQGCVIAATKN